MELKTKTQYFLSSLTSRRRANEDAIQNAMDDWGCFIYAICKYIGIKLNWISRYKMKQTLEKDRNRPTERLSHKIEEDIVSAFTNG